MQYRRIIQQDRQCQYKRNIEERSCNHCCGGKTISITYCKCACSLNYPAGILPSVACPAIQYFSTLSQKHQDFRKKVTE